MTATQLPLSFAQRHNNQQLFSDHYLNVTLPQRAEWKLLAGDARDALQRVGAILASFQPSQNEAQTEKDLVRPVLEALGHTFEVQAALKTPDGTKKPDYIFYQSQEALNSNKNKTLDDQVLQSRAFAVGGAWCSTLLYALATPNKQHHSSSAATKRANWSNVFPTL